ncbi:hypothetical protein Ancab_033192, partial [Ancistrocladus abbreviatus]
IATSSEQFGSDSKRTTLSLQCSDAHPSPESFRWLSSASSAQRTKPSFGVLFGNLVAFCYASGYCYPMVICVFPCFDCCGLLSVL